MLLGVVDAHLPTSRRKVLQDNLPDRLQSFNFEDITLGQIKRLRKLLAQPGFDEELVRSVCPAAAPLAAWCRTAGHFLTKTRSWAPAAEAAAPAAAAEQEKREKKREDVASEARPAPLDAELQARAGVHSYSQVTSNGLVVTPDLARLSYEELSQVSELEVTCPSVGSITFHGLTDCRGMDIASLVHLDVGEVLVYPVQDLKPQQGEGLNKCSTVTMYQCWPPNGRGHLEDASARERYRGKIRQMTEDKRARFIDYDCSTGVWKFQVDHF